MSATTRFARKLGSNLIWGFKISNGKSGVAILDVQTRQQVIVNDDNIEKLFNLIKVYVL